MCLPLKFIRDLSFCSELISSRLLATGQTPFVRNAAAQQLADAVKQHPEDLLSLLSRVVPLLHSRTWETRVAAAKAIGGIVENAELYDPNKDDLKAEPMELDNGPNLKSEMKHEGIPVNVSDFHLYLDNLDIKRVLKFGKELTRGTGEKRIGLSGQEKLDYEKKTLPCRLGLGDTKCTDDEPCSQCIQIQAHASPQDVSPPNGASNGSSDAKDALKSPDAPNGTAGLSARQLNVLKRKRKKEAMQAGGKNKVIDLAERRKPAASMDDVLMDDDLGGEDVTGKVKDYFSLDRPSEVEEDVKVVSEFKGQQIAIKSEIESEAEASGAEWPFERLCELLEVNLFDSSWEIRHGASLGLREIIRVHGHGAGREAGKSRAENDLRNKHWLDDLACKLCCVLTLDRFGDYVSDNVVAPIRESIGQTLGALLMHLPSESVHAAFGILQKMVMQDTFNLDRPAWAVCHGGMIGLRYLVAVRNDLLLEDGDLIDGVIQAVMKGLGDADDDVRSVSAATLIPIAQDFVNLRPNKLKDLIEIVWACLMDLGDDLSASTGQIMDLLAKLCSFPEVLEAMKENALEDPEQSFAELVPRLYPFLRHTISSVRSAVLRALLKFVSIEGEGTRGWLNGRVLRLIFQNILVERNDVALELSLEVWAALVQYMRRDIDVLANEFAPHVDPLMQLTLHPIGVSRHPIPMNPSLFMRPSGSYYAVPSHMMPQMSPTNNGSEPPPAKRRRRSAKPAESVASSARHDVDGHMMQGDIDLVTMEIMVRSRVYASRAMGLIMSVMKPEILGAFDANILRGLESVYASTQVTAATIIQEYADHSDYKQACVRFIDRLQNITTDERPLHYRDLLSYIQVVRAHCSALLHSFHQVGKVSESRLPTLAVVCQGDEGAGPDAFSIINADKVVQEDFQRLQKFLSTSQKVIAKEELDENRAKAVAAIDTAKQEKVKRDVRIKAAAAGALVALEVTPKKPSSIIKGLMDSVKSEENAELQTRSSRSIARLIRLFNLAERRGIADKVVSNLANFYCVDTSATPEFGPNYDIRKAILSLRKEEDRKDHPDAAKFAREARDARITRRGTKEALDQLSALFGPRLFDECPALAAVMKDALVKVFEVDMPAEAKDPNNTLGQTVIDGMSIMSALTPKFAPEIHSFVMSLLPYVVKALQCELSVFRYMAAKCLASVCNVITVDAFTLLVERVLPTINNPIDLSFRQGAIECIYHLVSVMGDGILPYVVFLIVPVLGRMSDSDNDVRLLATTTFATLVKLVPLEAGIPDPPGISAELLKGRERERTFISQLLDPHKVEPFEMPVAIKATLRSYQQEGVNWLHFLNKFHLHGILCDDMGLGKTLQTLCIVASDHHLRAKEFEKTGAPDVRRTPSLIVCPPTLSGHWQQEIRTYAPFLTCTAYVGPPQERGKVRDMLDKTDIVITSYDICRNDVDVLAPINWNYLVLDEGHLIKNPRAKVTIAVKRLLSNHRLILSGTPIQNNVLELWSLFDFLMPGFLGAEKVFLDRFAKPIAASRFGKPSSKEQEAGALAIEALHKQVLPFLLRRLKEEVLDDLPPKIVQNYYCDLSELQKKLFEDFTKKNGKTLAEKASSGDKESKQHIFQALQYMRKLCNSPALVMKEGHKQYEDTQRFLAKKGTSLTDPEHAPKLTALRDLLVDCGIGSEPAPGEATSLVSPHRALIFCQMKEMLDMVQNQVLRRMLPKATFLRLDGSIESSKRQDIVNNFNSDPSIDVLLLTTSVGGLGLNLTGADTVIFVEHDWNPQKDLQAMDRAHRIGQKKVVNVYRLITRGTLEEKIMSLQRFKIDVASTVVNQQNAGLGSMETDQILDLFSLGDTDGVPMAAADDQGEEDAVDATGEVREKGKKGYLDEIGELWDEGLYEEEFSLDGFLGKMKG